MTLQDKRKFIVDYYIESEHSGVIQLFDELDSSGKLFNMYVNSHHGIHSAEVEVDNLMIMTINIAYKLITDDNKRKA